MISDVLELTIYYQSEEKISERSLIIPCPPP